MRTRLGLALALALGAGACNENTPASIDAEVTNPTRRFVAGDVLRYRFDWKVDAASDAKGILPGDMQLAAGVHLAGELALRVYPPTDVGTPLGLTLVRLDTHAVALMGHDALPDASELTGREAIVVVDADGEFVSLHFANDAPGQTPRLFRELLPGLLAQIDLRLPAHDGSLPEVRTGSGLADVAYAWTTPTRLARTIEGYRRFDAFSTSRSAEANGRLEITLDGDGWPLDMSGDERLSAFADDRAQQFASHTSFSLDRIAVDHGPSVAAPELSAYSHVDPNAPPDDASARRMLAQRFSRGLTSTDVGLAVYAAGSGLRPRPDFIVRATGRLRGWPESAAELEPMFDDAIQPAARTLIIDMLASAGTPEAQTLMCQLLADPAVRETYDWAGWVQRFAFVWRPRPGVARFLLDEHALAHAQADTRSVRALAYPMGTVAGRLAKSDPIAAAALRTRLREDLEAATAPDLVRAAIGGLGNAAAPEDLTAILAHQNDETAGVRGAVAIALRWQSDPSATAALRRLAADEDQFVAGSAITAIDQRRNDGDAAENLAMLATSSAYEPGMADRLTAALLRRIDDDPAVRPAIAMMRERTLDPQERNRIDATLLDAGQRRQDDCRRPPPAIRRCPPVHTFARPALARVGHGSPGRCPFGRLRVPQPS